MLSTSRVWALVALGALWVQAAEASFPDDAYPFDCVEDPADVRWVFENHFEQLNKCSIEGLKDERVPETQLFFGPTNIAGEAEVDAVFDGFCTDFKDGGLNGLNFKEEKAQIVGNVISVQWVADADFLAEPYRGSDSYVTCNRKMITITSSFDGNELVFKDTGSY